MKYMLIQYTVRPEAREEAMASIREFLADINRHEPEVPLYGAFYQQPDENTFVHVVAFATDAAAQLHESAPHKTRFYEKLAGFCTAPPTFTDLKAVASN